jgi:hypothetical protein
MPGAPPVGEENASHWYIHDPVLARRRFLGNVDRSNVESGEWKVKRKSIDVNNGKELLICKVGICLDLDANNNAKTALF